MLNGHAKVGIAQIVFYVPIVVLAIYVLYRNGAKRPHMAWISLVPFSLIRLAGGIVVILLENNPSSIGLLIATYILLGIGVILLLISSLGLLRIILVKEHETTHMLHRFIVLLMLGLLASTVLLVVGGSLKGDHNSESSTKTGSTLVKAGYILFAVLTALVVDFASHLYYRCPALTRNSMIILKGFACVVPFLAVRNVYAIISAFGDGPNNRWDSIHGSAAIFACMVLLMEYIVVSIYLCIGLAISHDQIVRDADNDLKTAGNQVTHKKI